MKRRYIPQVPRSTNNNKHSTHAYVYSIKISLGNVTKKHIKREIQISKIKSQKYDVYQVIARDMYIYIYNVWTIIHNFYRWCSYFVYNQCICLQCIGTWNIWWIKDHFDSIIIIEFMVQWKQKRHCWSGLFNCNRLHN